MGYPSELSRFCRFLAVTVFTNTKLLPSAEAAFKVLQTVFPLPLVLLASFIGGVLVAARSPDRSLAASASAVAMARMTRDFLTPSPAPQSLPKLCPSMRMNAGPWIQQPAPRRRPCHVAEAETAEFQSFAAGGVRGSLELTARVYNAGRFANIHRGTRSVTLCTML